LKQVVHRGFIVVTFRSISPQYLRSCTAPPSSVTCPTSLALVPSTRTW
jgi:hypothetical protein